MSSASIDNLWPAFERLFVDRYCPNFWSIEDIELPYGHVMVIDPNDMQTMLWRGDLTAIADYNTILEDVSKIQERHKIPVGFSISNSWQGDVEGFKDFIKNNGYQLDVRFRWLFKDISDLNPLVSSSGYVIEETRDVDTFASIMRIGFSNDVGDIFLAGALKNIDDQARGYVVAKDPKTMETVGCGAAYYHDECAYMSCLAVKPEHRRRGIAKDLVQARIRFLQENGAKYIVTAVKETNTASLNVQKQSGYVPCATTEYWMKY